MLTKFKFLFSPAQREMKFMCIGFMCPARGTYGQTFVIQAIKCWSMRSARRNAWKHVTFRKYVAATRNSPGYVVLNHRPRRNARTYTPPGSGGTFRRKVSRKARSLFRKTSSNVPRRLGVLPLTSVPYPKPLPSAVLHHDKRGTLDGILMKSHAVYELPRSAQLWQVICTRDASAGIRTCFDYHVNCRVWAKSRQFREHRVGRDLVYDLRGGRTMKVALPAQKVMERVHQCRRLP